VSPEPLRVDGGSVTVRGPMFKQEMNSNNLSWVEYSNVQLRLKSDMPELPEFNVLAVGVTSPSWFGDCPSSGYRRVLSYHLCMVEFSVQTVVFAAVRLKRNMGN